MHRNGRGHTREEVVKQVREGKDPSLCEWKTYVPIGNAAEKLRTWRNQGLGVFYLTSRREPTEVEDIKDVLKKHNFPEGQLLFRQEGEEYKDIAEKVMPDIIVEDDCESIGGKDEMTYTHIKPELKRRIKSIAVREFSGIDHLPDDISQL